MPPKYGGTIHTLLLTTEGQSEFGAERFVVETDFFTVKVNTNAAALLAPLRCLKVENLK